ncbi:MAG TPA: hypothetical protein DCZ92_06275 [Elusimicrobia bacterium]|nr:MAG: hypothetical protein A2016_06290 [Elusimicrobia bacterium GWF2_62_30]HBA60412.1 hypothetical protein [Elusimicrobiota bacterium]
MADTTNQDWKDKVFLAAWRPYAWIAATGFLLYNRALSFGFTFLDDNVLILNNLDNLRSWAIIPQAFTRDVFFTAGGAFYRPLLTLSLALDAQLGGTLPFFYHLSGIFLHLAAAALLYRLFLRLEYGKGLSLFSALVFTVHPALSQAVAWIPGRNDSLAAIFVILSFTQFIRFRSGAPGRRGAYALHLVFFALALLTKESAAIMPAAFLAYALLISRERSLTALLREAAGWAAVLLLWHFLRSSVLQVPGLPAAAMARSVWTNLPAFLQYAGKAVLPVNLSVMPALRDTTSVYGLLSAGVIACALILGRPKRRAMVVFGFTWFAIFLLPSLIMNSPAQEDFMFEHRAYIPLAGLLLVFMELVPAELSAGAARLAGAAGLAWLCLLASVTSRHLPNFEDRLKFWGSAAAASPGSPLIHRNLGIMYFTARLYGPAEKEYLTAIALNPSEPIVHSNLGVLYMDRGRLKEAEKALLRELELNPRYDNGHFNLAMFRRVTGRKKEMAELLEKTLELNPGHLYALRDLALLTARTEPCRSAAYLGRLEKLDRKTFLAVKSAIAAP